MRDQIPLWTTNVPDVRAVLTALSDAGYAVVPVVANEVVLKACAGAMKIELDALSKEERLRICTSKHMGGLVPRDVKAAWRWKHGVAAADLAREEG